MLLFFSQNGPPGAPTTASKDYNAQHNKIAY